jgi:hypothetical protein
MMASQVLTIGERMSYTILVIRNGVEQGEWKTYRDRHEYECAKTQWKKLAKRNRKGRDHVFGEVLAVIPQCERMRT